MALNKNRLQPFLGHHQPQQLELEEHLTTVRVVRKPVDTTK